MATDTAASSQQVTEGGVEDGDDDEDDSESDDESLNKAMEAVTSDVEDVADDLDEKKGQMGPRTKNEVVEESADRVTPDDIQPQDEVAPCGEVLCTLTEDMTSNTAIIQAPDNTFPLEEGSVLCLLDRTPLGKVSTFTGSVRRRRLY